MYTEFYKLRDLPFQLGPDPRFFFGSSGHQRAMSYLTYGLNQGEGFIIITGDVGAGKTTLVGHLFSTLDSEKYIAAKIVTTQLDADDVLRSVTAAFGIQYEGLDKATLLRRLEAFLVQTHKTGRRALLVVDEAQNLTVRALEELRMLSNFQVGQTTLLQTFLLGQPNFRGTLASPELDQLRQRVIASYHLGPLSANETRSYVEHRLRTVGWANDPTFTADSYVLIYERTGGVPRKINTLCSRLLLFGFLEEAHIIDAGVVEQVHKELAQELPMMAQEREMPIPSPPPAKASQYAAPTPQAPPAAMPMASAEPVEVTELNKRVTALEQQVQAHQRSMKHAFSLAAEYFERTRS